MESVQFSFDDAFILMSVPRPGCDLSDLIFSYTFLERCAPPSEATLAACLAKAVMAGIMPLPNTGHYALTPEWFERIHALDEKYRVTVDGMIDFAEEFAAQDWPVVVPTLFTLDHDAYQTAVQAVQTRYDRWRDPTKRPT